MALPDMLQWSLVSGKIESMANEPMPSTAIRRGLADILIRVHRGEHIPITHYDRAAAVMVPPDWYQRAAAALAASDATAPRDSDK